MIDKYYIGSTSDIEARIFEHNKPSHKSKFTRKQVGEWNLVYKEKFKTNSEARKRENQIKRWKSKIKIAELVEHSRF